MGGFYGSVHVRADDHTIIRPAIQRVARRTGNSFLLAPARDHWVNIYPDDYGQDERIGREIAEAVADTAEHVLMLSVHDDDILAYQYYRAGKPVDSFNSCPDYFERVSPEERDRTRGRPELLIDLLPDRASVARLQHLMNKAKRTPGGTIVAVLSAIWCMWRVSRISNAYRAGRLTEQEFRNRMAGMAGAGAFASEQMRQIASLLGIANVPTAYEYMVDNGETDDIDGYEQFIRI